LSFKPFGIAASVRALADLMLDIAFFDEELFSTLMVSDILL
jgi:hypothetical protein